MTMSDEQPAENDDLVAYLDGELDGKARQAVEVKLSLDANVRTEAESLKKVWDLLDFLPKAQPTASFTERTLERLAPVTGQMPKVESPSQLSLPMPAKDTQPMPLPTSWTKRVGFGLAWTAAILIAVIGGYHGRGYIMPPPSRPLKNPDALSLADLRVIENLDWYRHIDDYEFLLKLEASGLFEDTSNQ